MGRKLWIVLGAALVVGACQYAPGTERTGVGFFSSLRDQFVQLAPTTAGSCARETGRYSGLHGCRVDGEIVTVARVIDGDTLTLTDGRAIQLIGIDAPEAGGCAARTATARLRAHVERERVELHREPGLKRDRSGRILAYVRYDGPGYADDIGHQLVTEGLAIPYPAYAGNDRYTATIATAAAAAAFTGRGLHDSACRSTDGPSPDRTEERDRARPVAPPQPVRENPVPPPPASPPTATTGASYYKNCDAVRAAGRAPLHRGDNGYRPALDRDNDGIACES